MPMFFGQDVKKKELIESLSTIFESIRLKYKISPGDFPEIDKMKVRR